MNNPEIRHEQVLNNPELQPPVGIDQVTPEQQASLTQEHSLMDRMRESKLGVTVATVAAIGAMGLAMSKESGAQAAEVTAHSAGHQASVSSLGITKGSFKKCRKGRPAFQTRIISPTPIKKVKGSTYESEVPSIDTEVKYKVQAKSCKKRKGVVFLMESDTTSYKKKVNMRAGQVRNFSYKLKFAPPNSDTSDPYRWYANTILLNTSSKGRLLHGSSTRYRYTSDQLAAASLTGPTQ